jgi:uncharacterized repeat protein (TIGR03803 family)
MGRLFKLLAAVLALGALAGQAHASAFRVAYSFRGTGDGAAPSAGLVMGKAGLLYGTAAAGGFRAGNGAGRGTVFQFDPARETLSVLHRFTVQDGRLPGGVLALGANGHLYGTLADGGPRGCGTVYDIDPVSQAYRTLYAFSCGADGGAPVTGVVADAMGMLFGTTSAGGGASGAGSHPGGTIFSLNPATGAMMVLHSFNNGAGGDGAGTNPLLLENGALYGSACVFNANPGSVFKLSLGTGTMQTLHQFSGPDGYCPFGPLVAGGGAVFGATRYGGTNEPAGGVLFKLDLATGRESTLYQFDLVRGLPPFGMTPADETGLVGARARGAFSEAGSTFRFDAATGSYRTLDNPRARRAFRAADPNPGLVVDGTTVYGTTSSGGAAGKGSIFEIIQ